MTEEGSFAISPKSMEEAKKIVRKIKGISELNMLKITFKEAMNLVINDKNNIVIEDDLYIKSNIKKLTNDEMTRRYTVQSTNNKMILEIKAILDNQSTIDKIHKEINEEFLQWFVNEQVEEEANASQLISKIKMVKDNPSALYLFDQELAKRVFVAE